MPIDVTRIYKGEQLTGSEALAGCGRCRRTIVVRLYPNLMQEFYYCSNHEDCDRARDAQTAGEAQGRR